MSQSETMTLTAPTLSATNFNLPSLHLLHDEILVILKDTENHLSEFNDNPEQAPLLLDSIDVLAQLACIFELISLKGGQSLSCAISHSLQKLYDNGDNNDTALIMDLSEAIMTLDRYIEFVLLTKTIEPSLLIPIINKLNVHIGQDALEAHYFAHFNSNSVIIANPEQNFQALSTLNLDSHLLMTAYRSGLNVALTYQEGSSVSTDMQQKLAAMSTACALIAAQSNRLFWQAAHAAVTDIQAILPLTLSQKQTLIYVEQQFNSYLPIMDVQFANLVSFACQREHATAQVLCEQYKNNRLDTTQYEQMRRFLFGPNRTVTHTVNDLIQGQINAIKEKVDDYTRGSSLNPAKLQASQIADDLVELSSTLCMLKLNTAADALKAAAVAVAGWQTPVSDDFDHLLLALMSAENAVITMAKMHTPGAVKLPLNNHNISLHQLDTAYDTLIEESRTAIASAEQALTDYLADASRDMLNIQNIPEMIRQVAGAIRFLQLPISGNMLGQLANYLQQRVLSEQSISDDTLADVADVLMSVDYRLEGFENNRPISKQSLDIALQSLSKLLAA